MAYLGRTKKELITYNIPVWNNTSKNCAWAVKDSVNGKLMAIGSTEKMSVIRFGKITDKDYFVTNPRTGRPTYELPQGYQAVKVHIVEDKS